MRKIFWLSIISLAALFFLSQKLLEKGYPFYSNTLSYPHFHNNPYLSPKQRCLMASYLLPLDHPLKPALDKLFSSSRVTENITTLTNAGFTIIANMPGSFVIVARHSDIPGYVFKLYLDSESRTKDGIPNCEWLIKRCIGAEKIRKVINQEKIKHFTIPEKWLYVLPLEPFSKEAHPQPIIVIATDMQLETEKKTAHAWKNNISTEHLDELYKILKHGYGTIGLVRNIPYTKNETFAFTDTEYPIRRLKLAKAKEYLSEDMQEYWARISKCDKKKKSSKKHAH